MATVLIIDDSQSVRTQLKEVLAGAGHKVIEAVDGNDGLEKLTTTSGLDVVISDYNMPGYDGVTMLSKAREKLGPAAKYPIIMLTTETSEQLKAAGKQAGVLAWIVKPFVPDKLLLAVSKLSGGK